MCVKNLPYAHNLVKQIFVSPPFDRVFLCFLGAAISTTLWPISVAITSAQFVYTVLQVTDNSIRVKVL
jgi:hypothetical protein